MSSYNRLVSSSRAHTGMDKIAAGSDSTYYMRLTEHTKPIVHGDHNNVSVGSKDTAVKHVP